jgi:citrate lyase subunit beta/citryl-CoA lyase
MHNNNKQVPRIRSALFVPSQRSDFIEKAHRTGADALIFDLEDSVAESGKTSGRENVRSWLLGRKLNETPNATVRINALDVGVLSEDLDAIVHKSLVAVLVPKIYGCEEIQEVDSMLSWFEGKRDLRQGSVIIWPIIETAKSVRDVELIASSSPRIAYLGGGTSEQGDLARSVGFEWSVEGLETLYIRSKVLIAARSAGISNPITGLVSGLSDLEDVRRFAQSSKNLGYSGMFVIHPSHVAIINEVFSPSVHQIKEAKEIIKALDNAGQIGIGAVTFEDRMIDVAMARTAQALLDEVQAIQQ